jgi:chromosome condensin MukBEF ATPase and DNA-binding subunit MukB
MTNHFHYLKSIVLKDPEDLKQFVVKMGNSQSLIVDLRQQSFSVTPTDQRKLHRIYINAVRTLTLTSHHIFLR